MMLVRLAVQVAVSLPARGFYAAAAHHLTTKILNSASCCHGCLGLDPKTRIPERLPSTLSGAPPPCKHTVEVTQRNSIQPSSSLIPKQASYATVVVPANMPCGCTRPLAMFVVVTILACICLLVAVVTDGLACLLAKQKGALLQANLFAPSSQSEAICSRLFPPAVAAGVSLLLRGDFQTHLCAKKGRSRL